MHPWTYYLEKTRNLVARYDNPRVLKTDCNNEVEGRPLVKGIAGNIKADTVCLEYDKNLVDRCKQMYPDIEVISGDIRELPFKDEEFDIVLDLSTLDHIPEKDVEKTIREYHRVSRDYLLLIVWYGTPDLVENTNRLEFRPENQYYFDQEKTRELLDKYFDTEEEDFDFYKQNKSWLGYHLLRKK